MVHEENDIKAVIFDMGGVILQYNDMETFVKLISTVEKHPVLAKAMERLEIGELTLEDAPTIAKECIEAEPETKAIFDLLKPKEFSNHLSTCPYFAEALKQIRSAGLQTALLTNNFYVDTARTKSTVLPNAEDKFDVVVESCREETRPKARGVCLRRRPLKEL
ncbi:hypothetical protein QR680_008209 [Steinernema hermaphroditum]|uniref:Uncharacterized protein n=1 Tax=Steinernema hermaphroditum TaxID=289476 RepID=A0AA39M7G5_9BILA|nr:hypothetical protein QR680_008209 [Steinernema hermaphroditum]